MECQYGWNVNMVFLLNMCKVMGLTSLNLLLLYLKMRVLYTCNRIYTYKSEQNDRVESHIHHVVDTGLALLVETGFPKHYWPYAF